MLWRKEMTRDELFERYVADTLDEEALAELARLREEDVEFAAQFDADLVATVRQVMARARSEREVLLPPVRPQ